MKKLELTIEMQSIPTREIVGYSGDEEIDRMAVEIRENRNYQLRSQVILDRHYNAMYYQSYLKK
jgi:hypothetical protein